VCEIRSSVTESRNFFLCNRNKRLGSKRQYQLGGMVGAGSLLHSQILSVTDTIPEQQIYALFYGEGKGAVRVYQMCKITKNNNFYHASVCKFSRNLLNTCSSYSSQNVSLLTYSLFDFCSKSICIHWSSVVPTRYASSTKYL